MRNLLHTDKDISPLDQHQDQGIKYIATDVVIEPTTTPLTQVHFTDWANQASLYVCIQVHPQITLSKTFHNSYKYYTN